MYRLLIIDDDKSMTHPVKYFFEMRNYRVDVAHNGRDGLNCIRDNKPDIVFLDIGLPDISGPEVLEKIRENDRHMKVVMMSGYNKADKIKKAQSLGISEYIQKPLILECLEEKTNRIEKELLEEKE